MTQTFLASQPFEQFTKDQFIKDGPDADPEPATGVYVRLIAPVPDEFSDVAIEAMDALRSALDHACFASASALGATDAKSAYFPFADDAPQLENTIKGRCKDLHPEVVALLRTFSPYKEGDSLLWAFNKARQSNQHKVLCDIRPVRNEFGFSCLDADHPEQVGLMFQPGAESDEILVALFPNSANVRKVKVKSEFYIAFDNAGFLTGEPAVSTLHAFAGKVEGILMAIEAETRRIAAIL